MSTASYSRTYEGWLDSPTLLNRSGHHVGKTIASKP